MKIVKVIFKLHGSENIDKFRIRISHSILRKYEKHIATR